jgi:hypothetical protein
MPFVLFDVQRQIFHAYSEREQALPQPWNDIKQSICFLFRVRVMFNSTFNNISVISWSAWLVEETGIPGDNHRPVASHWQTLSHNVVSSTFRLSGIRTHICIGSYKSNYLTIMATATPVFYLDNLMRLYKWLIA